VKLKKEADDEPNAKLSQAVWRNFAMTAARRALLGRSKDAMTMLKGSAYRRHPIRCFSIASGIFSVCRSRRRAI
jgi:hypothetical protein